MKRLWCEWDIGAEDLVFTSTGAAYAWLADNATVQEMIGPGEEFANVGDIFDAGLMGFTDLEVID